MRLIRGLRPSRLGSAYDVGDFLGATLVRTEEGSRGKEVRVADAPFAGNFINGVVIEGEEGFPEEGVVVAEFGGGGDVEAVVEEDKAGFAGGEALNEDVSGVRVAVDLWVVSDGEGGGRGGEREVPSRRGTSARRRRPPLSA